MIFRLTLSSLVLLFALPASAEKEEPGTLIFEDRFERNESQEEKDEPGNEWTTSSDRTANGHKQVDLKNGAMHIRTHETANHAASVRHAFEFTDGTLALRLKLPNEGDSIKLNFADLDYQPVHAGHLFNVDIGLDKVVVEDLREGVMNLELRKARKAGTLSDAQKTKLAACRKAVKHELARDAWHEVVVQVRGSRLCVEIDGEEVIAFRSAGFAHPTKRLLRLLPPKSAVVDDVRIWRAEPSDDGFEPLLTGEDLTGWEGDPALWKVEGGVVVGTCEGPDHFEHNTFLIWRGGKVKNFELQATMRVVGDNNSGIQYRSRELPEVGPFAISGYQCDVHPAIEHTAMTYEEKGRGIFGLNGKNVLLDPDRDRWLLSEHDPVAVDVGEWQEYTVIARGNHLIHQVNGNVTSELIDCDEEGRSLEGLLAIQLHRGNPHRVEIKDLRLRTLEDDAEIIAFDAGKLLKDASRIERPRTSRPQGTGPVQPKKAN
mgnify:CR=1 FL=1